jgi:hypothetical protein
VRKVRLRALDGEVHIHGIDDKRALALRQAIKDPSEDFAVVVGLVTLLQSFLQLLIVVSVVLV